MDPLEWELSPATAAWRDSRRALWAAINAAKDDYFNDAKKYTTPENAARAAGKHVRGDVRSFFSDLITRIPAGELPAFLRKIPPTWPEETEILLNEPTVDTMIGRSFPVREEAAQLDILSTKVAEDDAAWNSWLNKFADQTGQALREAAKGGADAAKNFATGLGWLPVAVVAGATVVGLAYVLVGKAPPPTPKSPPG